MKRANPSLFVAGRLSMDVPPNVVEEVQDLVESRLGLTEGEVTRVVAGEIIGAEVEDFIRSERLLRYIDRDVETGKFDRAIFGVERRTEQRRRTTAPIVDPGMRHHGERRRQQNPHRKKG